MRLDHTAQSVTLTKCKPGKSYDISLVVLTSTEAARREKKRVSLKHCNSSFLLKSNTYVYQVNVYSTSFLGNQSQ